MSIFISRLWINKSSILKLACTYTGVFFTLWGFISLFNPLDGFLPNETTTFCRLLIGLSYFDNHLNAQTSKADFVLAVQKLIEFCNQNAQGNPVILPLLGSGLSRTKIDLNNILHYLVDTFAINKDIINNDFYIVVWKGDKDRVAIQELRKW